MPELENLYSTLQQDRSYEIDGDKDYFMEKYGDEANLKTLHSMLSKDDKYDAGTWEYFSGKYGIKKKDSQDIFAPYDPSAPPSDVSAPQDATAIEKPILTGINIDNTIESVRSDLQIEDESTAMSVGDYLELNSITPDEMADPSFKNMFTREGDLSVLDVEAADILLEKIRMGERALHDDIETIPAVQNWISKYPASGAVFNWLQGVNRGIANTVLPVMDGAQKLFYEGIGSLMETSQFPAVQFAGGMLKQQQEGATWWGEASDYMNKSLDENWPTAERGDALSRLVYDFGEFIPFLSTLYVTPNPQFAGMGMKLPLNLGGVSALGEYAQSQDVVESVKAGAVGAVDGLAIQMLGTAAGKAGQWTSQHLAKTIKPGTAGIVGASSNAAILTSGGAMHSVANQFAQTGEVDWQEVEASAMFWLMFGGEGMIRSAASAYHAAPRESINYARSLKIDVEALRERSMTHAEMAAKEKNPQRKIELMITAAHEKNFADLKAMENVLGSNKDAAIKQVKESKLPEKEKESLIAKIEESAAYIEYTKQTKELATAGDQLKAEGRAAEQPTPKTTEKASERGVEPLSTQSGTTPPLEGKSPLKSSTDRKSAARADENLKLLETSELPSRKSITEKIKDYVDNRLEKDFKKGGEKEMRLSEAESFTFSNAENLLGTDKARVRSVEDIKKLKSELSESLKNIEAEMAGRTEQAPLKEGQVRYGDKVYESAGALRSDLMKVENIDRLPLSNDPTVMRVLNEVKQEKGILPKEAQDRAVRKQAEKPTYTQQEIDRVPQMREQAKELKQQAEPLDIMDPKKKELLAEAKDINKQADRIERFAEREQTKTQQDAVQKPSAEKMDVGKVPQDGKKVGERDAKKPEAPAKEIDITTKEGKDRYWAETAQESASISAKEFNPKVEKLKQQFEKHKADEGTRRWAIDSFIKAHKAKIDAAGISSAQIKALSNAKTWPQVRNALSKVEKSMQNPSPKMRAAEMTDFIKGNKGLFKGLNSRAYDAMLKKVAEASTSDAKLNSARKYMEDILGKKEAVELANEKANVIAQIEKEVSAKALFEKGAQGGQKKRVKASRRTQDIELSKTVEELGQFVKEGKSKRTPDPAAEMDRVLRDLAAERDPRRAEELHERIIQLQFADLNNVGVETARALRDYAKSLTVEGRIKAAQEKEARIEKYTQLTDLHIKEISAAIPPSASVEMASAPSRTRKVDIYREMSFPSLLSTMARKGEFVPGQTQPFSDKLNMAVTRTEVMPSERKMDGLRNQHTTELNDIYKKLFGSRLKGEMAVIEANNPIEKTGIFVYDKNGRPVQELAISKNQAAEKILQSRDANGYASMTKPLDKGGMGYTTQTFEQMKSYVGKDYMKFTEWMYENQKKWGEKEYNPAYERQNGIPFADFTQGYWQMTRDPSKTGAITEVGERVSSIDVPSRRTISRSGTTTPLKYTSVIETYQNYINETIRYASWAESSKTLHYIYKNPKVRDAIKQAHGTTALKVTDHFLDVFAGRYTSRATIPAIDFLVNNSAKSILAFKTMTGVKQMLSSAYYGVDMPMQKVLYAPIKSYAPKSVGAEARKWLNTSEFMQSRGQGAYLNLDMGMNESMPMFGKRGKEWSKTYAALQRGKVTASAAQRSFDQAQGVIIKYGDRYPITVVGAEYLQHKYQQYAKKPLTKSVLADHISGKKISPELERAKNDWEWSSFLMQQSTRESNVSMMRRDSSWGRAFGQFTSGPAQIWRAEADALRRFKKATDAKDTKGQWNALKALSITHVLSGALFGLADNKFKWDTKHMAWSMAKGNVEGVLYLGRAVASVIDKIEGKPWAEATLGQVPFTKYILGMQESAITIADQATAPSPDFYEMNQAYKELILNTAMVFGVGIEGVMSLTEGASRAIKGESEQIGDVLGWTQTWDPNSVSERKDKLRNQADRAIGWKKGEMTVDEEAVRKVMKGASEQGLNPIEIMGGVMSSEGYKFKQRAYGGIKTQSEFNNRIADAREDGDEFGVAIMIGMYPDFVDEVMVEQTDLVTWDKRDLEDAMDDMIEILNDRSAFYREMSVKEQDQEND